MPRTQLGVRPYRGAEAHAKKPKRRSVDAEGCPALRQMRFEIQLSLKNRARVLPIWTKRAEVKASALLGKCEYAIRVPFAA